MNAEMTTIYWRDIPAQVSAKAGRKRVRAEMPRRFGVGIDRAAVVAGLTDSNLYLSQWRKVVSPCSDDVQGDVEMAIQRLDASLPQEMLAELVARGGAWEDPSPAAEPRDAS